MNGQFDTWKMHDTRREDLEACAEGEHRVDRRDGCCVYCGAEDPTFDPDYQRDLAQEAGRDG
jgi:hypothetical protein